MPDHFQRIANPYHNNRFVYDEATDSYRCPKGEKLSFVRPEVNKGVSVRPYQPATATGWRRKRRSRRTDAALH